MTEQILLSPPHMSGREQDYINEAFETNWITTMGTNVSAFEQALADYDDVHYALTTNSGTAALHLALLALGVRAGDLVFCQSFTFIASANPVRYIGAELTFIDSEPTSWNMSPQALKRALAAAATRGRLPKAIIVVHLFGQSADMPALKVIADEYEVPIVEDAAESLGAEIAGRKSGTLGAIGIHSFNGNKMITTGGGGCMVTDVQAYHDRALHLATQAKEARPYYFHIDQGYNYRLSNIAAGIGRAQLAELDGYVAKRRQLFDRYQAALGDRAGVQFQPELPHARGTRWLTALTIEQDPWWVMQELAREQIESRAVWKPLHQQPLFAGVPYYQHQPDRDVCAEIFDHGLCLPSGSAMTDDQQDRVIRALQGCLQPEEGRT